MTVIVELKSARMVADIFKHTKNLAGSSIFIERDLNTERRGNKKLMLQLKKEIQNADRSKKIAVRGDKLVVEGRYFVWNTNNILMCEKREGKEVLQNIYGDTILNVSLEYNTLLAKINTKN